MSSIKNSLLANFLGKIWTTLISIILLPYYVKIIGVEAYGLVGIYTSLLALFSVLDLGLSTSMNREMARMSSQQHLPEEFRNLTRTLEVIYWSIAVLIGLIIFMMAPLIADHWVNAKELSSATIKQSIYCIGLSLAFLWPTSLYSGGLMGLQNQVLLNSITIIVATLRGVGMLLVLVFISPTIQAFFIWQIFVNILQTTLAGLFLWKKLPKSFVSAKFDLTLLTRLKKFAMGITGITIAGIIYSQMDKIFLSRILTLDVFGYYTLAATIAGVLFHIMIPIYSVFFPHFNQLVSSNDTERLKHVYHLGCQIMSSFVLPTALLVILFAPELIFLWTHSVETVQSTSLLVRLLMIGTLLNVLLALPTSLQYAHGWTKLAFYLYLFGALALLPTLYWTIHQFGAIGAAWAVIIMNGCILVVSIQMMHRRILKAEKWSWITLDVGLPSIVTLIILSLARLIFPEKITSDVTCIAFLAGILILSLIFSIFLSPSVRRWAIKGIFKRQPKTLSGGS